MELTQKVYNRVVGTIVVLMCALVWPIALPILVIVLMTPDNEEEQP